MGMYTDFDRSQVWVPSATRATICEMAHLLQKSNLPRGCQAQLKARLYITCENRLGHDGRKCKSNRFGKLKRKILIRQPRIRSLKSNLVVIYPGC